MKLSKVKQLIKEELHTILLNERLGVPENITNVATQVFDGYLQHINNDLDDTSELDDDSFELDGGFDIADLHIDRILVSTTVEDITSDIEWIGMSVESLSRFKSNSNLKLTPPPQNSFKFNSVTMNMRISIPSGTPIEEVIHFLKQRRSELIGSFAHELKHRYDEYKNIGGRSAVDRAKYTSSAQFNVGGITPINKFMFLLYFISGIESLVRSTEVAADMEAQGITKKDFIDALNQNRTFKELRSARDWTYSGFREELKNYTTEIADALEQTGIKTDGMSDEDLINKILEVVMVSFINLQANTLYQIIQDPTTTSQILQRLAGQSIASSKDMDEFSKQLNKMQKFGRDYNKYFTYCEKMFHTLATQTIKKVSKIYDLLPNDTISEVNIVNPELWYKLYGYKGKLSTEYKKFKV